MLQPRTRHFGSWCLLALLGLARAVQASGQIAVQESYVIERVEIEGLERTDPYVVKRELRIAQNAKVTREEINAAIQRLRNMQIFKGIEERLEPTDIGRYVLRLKLEEKWTTIPIIKFSGGGGKSQVTVGGYDVNLFGKYLEAGAQYEKLEHEKSGVLWFRNPRLLDSQTEIFISLWSIKRDDALYEDYGKTNLVEGRLLNTRKRVSVTLEHQFLTWLRAGVLLDYNVDHCSPSTYVEEDEVRQAPKDHVPNVHAFLPGAKVKIGNIDYNGYLIDGARLDYTVQGAREGVFSNTSYVSHETTFSGYKTLPWKSTAAMRLGLGLSNTRRIQYYYFVGGLDRVRGFAAGRFYGRNYWLANFEYRLPVLDRSWLVTQAVLFHDAVGLSVERNDLDQTTASSLGLGARFIIPKVYRLVLRIDYAMPVVRDDMQPISFGIQQFF